LLVQGYRVGGRTYAIRHRAPSQAAGRDG
jgi:hypothetical protein